MGVASVAAAPGVMPGPQGSWSAGKPEARLGYEGWRKEAIDGGAKGTQCVRGPGCWVKGRERTMMALDKLPEEKCPLTSRESPLGRPRGQGGVSSPREVADGKGPSASAHPMA